MRPCVRVKIFHIRIRRINVVEKEEDKKKSKIK